MPTIDKAACLTHSKPMENEPEKLNDAVTQAVVAVQNGNEDAYGIVVEACQKKLRNTLAWRCPPQIDPDEVAHLAFLAAYKRIGQFKPGTDFYVWLWVFARNIMLGQINKAKRTARNRDNYMQRLMLEHSEHDPESRDAAEGADHVNALRECLATLSESARALMRDRYSEGLTMKAVADKLGRTVGAIKNQLFHVRESLRQCVSKKLRQDMAT